MKTLSDLIFEEKFSNFNELELKAFADQLEEMKKNVKFLQEIVKNRSRRWINPPRDAWTKVHEIPKSDKIEYGRKYIVVFDNPFATTKQLSKKYYDYNEEPEACSPDEDKVIIAIAIADKFGKLHLVNQWEKDCTIQYRNKGLYFKTKKEDSKFTDVFYSDKGWYLYRKGFASYYIHQEVSKSGVNDIDVCYPEKQENTFVRLEDCVILDMSTLPAQFEKMQAEIEKRAKEHEEWKKREEERLKAEEERKKWWKEREGYKHLGCANGWTETPEEIKKAHDDKEAKWYGVTIGRCYHQYFCDKYKITYTVDSSD